MDDELDQATLMELLARKDNRAYRYLYRRYYVALRNLARYYVKGNAMAEDLVQDVFVAMLGCDYKFTTENEIKYFLYRSLKNACVSYLRKLEQKYKYIREAQSLPVNEEHFWDKVLEEDVYARLMAAIETLPPQCKLVMELTLEGVKGSDIAERLQVSLDTVKEYKKFGKKELAKRLRDGEMRSIIFLLFM